MSPGEGRIAQNIFNVSIVLLYVQSNTCRLILELGALILDKLYLIERLTGIAFAGPT